MRWYWSGVYSISLTQAGQGGQRQSRCQLPRLSSDTYHPSTLHRSESLHLCFLLLLWNSPGARTAYDVLLNKSTLVTQKRSPSPLLFSSCYHHSLVAQQWDTSRFWDISGNVVFSRGYTREELAQGALQFPVLGDSILAALGLMTAWRLAEAKGVVASIVSYHWKRRKCPLKKEKHC